MKIVDKKLIEHRPKLIKEIAADQWFDTIRYYFNCCCWDVRIFPLVWLGSFENLRNWGFLTLLIQIDFGLLFTIRVANDLSRILEAEL